LSAPQLRFLSNGLGRGHDFDDLATLRAANFPADTIFGRMKSGVTVAAPNRNFHFGLSDETK